MILGFGIALIAGASVLALIEGFTAKRPRFFFGCLAIFGFGVRLLAIQ